LAGNSSSVLRAAAAHVLGARQVSDAGDALLATAKASEDLLRAEAGYALARIGVEEGAALLRTCLDRPVQAYLGGPVAAGFLARLGDPRGFAVVQDALSQENLIVRVVGAKQLLFFVPFDGQQAAGGGAIDVYAEFERALHDEHRDVAWLAVLQLREVQDPRAEALLERVRRTTGDDQLRRLAGS
ncbi:MAG: HEAT repeat domain-containing protein, partial [Acidimicrobiales bacterium]